MLDGISFTAFSERFSALPALPSGQRELLESIAGLLPHLIRRNNI
ncbi:MAG: hypothetical protein V8S82_05760 [Eubacteriales bacterium]